MEFETLQRHHDRSAFDCGLESVNRYLRGSARQQVGRGMALTTVLVPSSGSSEVVGFHTTLMSTVRCAHIPVKGLPAHQVAPVVLLAQFGVSLNYQGRGFGKDLLFNALERSLLASKQVGCMGVVLDAADDKAREFYLSRGFAELSDSRMHLWLPIRDIEKMFAD